MNVFNAFSPGTVVAILRLQRCDDNAGTGGARHKLMALADRGLVTLATREYRLADANQALKDLHHGLIKGRAGLIP